LHPNTNQLLREHLRQKRGGYRIQEEDHPKKMPLSTAQLLRRAEHAGAQTGKLCQLLYQRQGETAIRRILGVLSLLKKYGASAVEDACATALDIGVHEYRFVRRYLERRPHPQMFLRQIEEIADAALDGKRKEHMELLSTVPLLIIDDLGMRKLGPTAAEELLEIVMRRYERASTLLTSNRPVEDWGKLLGDSAAVTAMLDRLLHHGHLLKCGPRSWRTKTDAAEH
jgi:IstB-like ATP binding protein